MSSRPRVVQIGKYYFPEMGGIENNVRQVAQVASERFESLALCMRKGRGGRERSSDGPVSVVRLRSFGSVWRQEIVESPLPILREAKPDILHFHTPNPLLAFPIWTFVKKHGDVKLVVSHHADLQRPTPIRQIANMASRNLIERADKIVSYTQTFAENAQELRGHLDKLAILPHGVALPPAQQEVRPPPPSLPRLRLGFIGRIEKWKGLDVVFAALGRDPDCSFTVAGDGGYRSEAEEAAKAVGLGARVTFLGAVHGAAKEAFFEAIDILVLPSLNAGESYGQVLVEAQLRGLPVIASDLPTGVREICDAGRAGLLFKPGDSSGLEKAIERLRDPRLFEATASAGMRRAQDRFSEPAVRSRIIDLYRGLLGDR